MAKTLNDDFYTSAWVRAQWSNPGDIFTILLIVGGDIVQKAIAQLTAGPTPNFTPVSFSFGWVTYAISAMLSAFGENRLMPQPELECILINTKSKYARTNRSWLLARLLRDLDYWMSQECKQAEINKLRELRQANDQANTGTPAKNQRDSNSIRIGLRVTVWKCDGANGRGKGDLVYWSGIAVSLTQILALGLPPVILYDEYFTITIASVGTALAWTSGLIRQWTDEKIGVRKLDLGSNKDVLLTQGQGAHDMIMLRAGPHNLDLEALAGSQRQLRNPKQTRAFSTLFALAWIGLIITTAGWDKHTWYLLGVGLLGMLHNVYAAGWERMPNGLGISLGDPLKAEHIFVDDKVMKVLWALESIYPKAGAAALDIFFPGGFENLKGWEIDAWKYAAQRYDQWSATGSPQKEGLPDIKPLPAPSFLDLKKFDSEGAAQSA